MPFFLGDRDAKGHAEILQLGSNDSPGRLLQVHRFSGAEISVEFLEQLSLETQGAMNWGAIGATAGNIVTITHPKAQLGGASLGERNGILVADCEIHFAETPSATGGDSDDISISFT